MENEKRIHYLSRFLRYACTIGMVGSILLPVIFWMYEGIWIPRFEGHTWYLDFINIPTQSSYAPTLVKLMTLLLELFHNAFFFIIFYILAKFFQLCEEGGYFNRKAVHYLCQVGNFLLLSQILRPFYVLLKGYIWAVPDQEIIISYNNLIGIKTLFLIPMIFLVAYILERGYSLEEDRKGVI